MAMKRVRDVLKRHSADRKKLKELEKAREELDRVLNARRDDIRGEEPINDKVRENDIQIKLACTAMSRRIYNDICDEDETSTASSSNSGRPEDESLSSSSNGVEHMNIINGMGGNGRTKINNKNARISFKFGKVQYIKKIIGRSRKRKRKE